MEHSKRSKKNKKKHDRKKRFVEPITITVIAVVVVALFVVSSIATWIYSYAAPGSSYNRLNDLEPRTDELTRRMNETTLKLNDMEIGLTNAKDMRGNLINITDGISAKVEIVRQAVVEVSSLTS